MKSLVLCKDCGDQFQSPHIDGVCGEFSEIAKINDLNIVLTHCMGKCPRDKISTILLHQNKINEFKIEEYSIETIKKIINQKGIL